MLFSFALRRCVKHGSLLLATLIGLIPAASIAAGGVSPGDGMSDPSHSSGSAAATAPAAVATSPLPERRLAVDAANPLNDFDANTAFWLSESELVGRAGDWLGSRVGLDNSVLGRGALSAGTLWLSVASSYYSHEVAHDFVTGHYGAATRPSLDFAHPWGALIPGYIHRHASTEQAPEARCLGLVSGLNQNQWLAREVWRSVAERGRRNAQEANTYLVWKLANLAYIAAEGLHDERPLGRELPPEYVDLFAWNRQVWNDIDMYVLYMYSRGVPLSKRGYLAQTMAADFLSFHTWESLWGTLRYVGRGERQHPLATVPLGHGARITPPLITAYATSEGTFYDLTSVLTTRSERQWLLSVGTDAAIVPHSSLERLRFGAQYRWIRWASLSAAPFAYLNVNRGTDQLGIDAGVDLRWRLGHALSLAASARYAERDVIENTVKAARVPDKGFKAIFGLRAVY